MVNKIDDRLPSHWKRSFPRYWNSIKEPKNWPQFYRETEREVRHREEFDERFMKRTWDEWDRRLARGHAEGSHYVATEPGGGRELRIEYRVFYTQLWEPATHRMIRNAVLANVLIEVK